MKDTPGQPDNSLPARRFQGPPVTAPQPEYVEDYAPEPPPPMGARKFTFRLLSRALRRHWWQAMLLWLIGSVGLVVLAYTRIQPTYDAISQVKVEVDNQDIFRQNGQQLDFQQFMQTQVNLISSPTIIASALAAHPELLNTPMLKGSADPEIDIRNALLVGMVPRTNLIQIAMSSPIPSEAAQLVNAVVDAYLKHAQTTYDSATQKKIDSLKVTRDEQNAAVLKQRLIVQGLGEQLGQDQVDAIRDENKASLDSYRRLSEEYTSLQIRVITTKAKLDHLRGLKELPRQQQNAEQLQMQIADAFYLHPRVASLQDSLEAAKQKLKKAERLTKNRSDPARLQAEERIKDIETQRDDLWRQLEPTLRRQVTSSPVDQSLENTIKETEIELTSQMTHEEKLKSMLEKVTIDAKGAQTNQQKLEYAKRDLQRAEGVLDRIDSTLDQYRFNARNQTTRVELNFDAKPSIRANSDKRRTVMGVAPVATGLLVMALLMLLELRGARVSDPEELASRMHLQVIGVVPPLPQIRVNPLGSNGDGKGGASLPATSGDLRAQRQLDEFVQSLDHLRVALCARRDPWGRDRHCVLITSACGSEGKTTLAAQLAERCVNAGLMTLLIDADLRNPTLSRMLDAAENPGLINVLRGDADAEDVMMVIGDAGGFHLLPAGNPRVDPSRLLQGDRLGKLIAQARESFDMIIVDAPPVLPVPDALTIGRWTDGAVLAVRYDTSRFPLVERANRRLAHVGVPVIGAVVNGVRSMESTYGGYYGYGYGSTVYGNIPTTTVEE